MKKTNVGNIIMNYGVDGKFLPEYKEQKTVVFIHDAFVNHLAMVELKNEMKKGHDNHHQYVLLDLPGHGESLGCHGNTLEYYARKVDDLLSRLIERSEISPLIELVGWGLGGSIALQMSLNKVHNILRLNLLNSASEWGFAKNSDLYKVPKDQLLNVITDMYVQSATSDLVDKERLSTLYRKMVSKVNHCLIDLEVLEHIQLTEQLSEIDIPVFMVSGKMDTFVEKRVEESMFEKLRNATVVYSEDFGELTLSGNSKKVSQWIKENGTLLQV